MVDVSCSSLYLFHAIVFGGATPHRSAQMFGKISSLLLSTITHKNAGQMKSIKEQHLNAKHNFGKSILTPRINKILMNFQPVKECNTYQAFGSIQSFRCQDKVTLHSRSASTSKAIEIPIHFLLLTGQLLDNLFSLPFSL